MYVTQHNSYYSNSKTIAILTIKIFETDSISPNVIISIRAAQWGALPSQNTIKPIAGPQGSVKQSLLIRKLHTKIPLPLHCAPRERTLQQRETQGDIC